MAYKKLIDYLKSKDYEILTDNTIDEKHLYSFWYDGIVIEAKKGKYVYTIEAHGDIEINDTEKLVYGNHRRPYEDKIQDKLLEDKDLKLIDEENYFWEHNNWFELFVLDTEIDENIDYDMDTYCSLDQFLDVDDFWKEWIEDYEKEQKEE